MSTSLTLITGNPNKAAQISKYLGLPVAHQALDLTEIQSLDLVEVVTRKAEEAYAQLKTPVIVDDVAFTIHALGQLPGTFIKFFLSELQPAGIAQLASNYPDKTATATVAIGYHDGQQVRVFLGEVHGRIADTVRGDRGFGFDLIFVPDGYTQTRSEMSEQDFDQSSHRRLALEKLEAFLKTNAA